LQRALPSAIVAPDGQSGTFWITLIYYVLFSVEQEERGKGHRVMYTTHVLYTAVRSLRYLIQVLFSIPGLEK